MNDFILGLLVSCFFIQVHTGRISDKLDEILYELKHEKDGDE